ncbi:deoxyuridine 5'-triphosphate nucleotidohydrolase-like [Folsomia candida]|nr:deoxyuridine 5'-triphosphate nucleotidohydrolase-like [Folsomia candida]XP_035714628.1 deoxyuridine 5'-triphosphate nucleotidohydrolase-like [Folsomia candida]
MFPRKATPGSAAYDLFSQNSGEISGGGVGVVETGIQVILPLNHFGLIKGRSGLAAATMISTAGGIIDHDYTGTMKIILHNNSSENFAYKAASRLGQLAVIPMYHGPVRYVEGTKKDEEHGVQRSEFLSREPRGDKGFGSTGQ